MIVSDEFTQRALDTNIYMDVCIVMSGDALSWGAYRITRKKLQFNIILNNEVIVLENFIQFFGMASTQLFEFLKISKKQLISA